MLSFLRRRPTCCPSFRKPQSPVDFFRQLLAMSPAERNNSLTNRPPESRARILAKVREYQALDPDERELRLRATDLRWYLTPLLQHAAGGTRGAPGAGAGGFARTRPVAAGAMGSSAAAVAAGISGERPDAALFRPRRNDQFSRSPARNSRKLPTSSTSFLNSRRRKNSRRSSTLSEAERAQMEKTLQSFEKLPPRQRYLCVRNYAKFAGMSAGERAEFLKNAENWSKMSPKERQAWRDLVDHVPHWPPMPPPIVPPNLIPHATAQTSARGHGDKLRRFAARFVISQFRRFRLTSLPCIRLPFISVRCPSAGMA